METSENDNENKLISGDANLDIRQNPKYSLLFKYSSFF